MYKVNGVIVDQYMNAQTVSNRDNIVVFFTKDYTRRLATATAAAAGTAPMPRTKKPLLLWTT